MGARRGRNARVDGDRARICGSPWQEFRTCVSGSLSSAGAAPPGQLEAQTRACWAPQPSHLPTPPVTSSLRKPHCVTHCRPTCWALREEPSRNLTESSPKAQSWPKCTRAGPLGSGVGRWPRAVSLAAPSARLWQVHTHLLGFGLICVLQGWWPRHNQTNWVTGLGCQSRFRPARWAQSTLVPSLSPGPWVPLDQRPPGRVAPGLSVEAGVFGGAHLRNF